MILYDMIFDLIWFDLIWFDEYDHMISMMISVSIDKIFIIWYDTIWYDMIWYDMIWYDMIWYDMIRNDNTNNINGIHPIHLKPNQMK